MNAVPIPIIRYDEEAASAAYAAYLAMLSTQVADPALTANPAWWRRRRMAYQQFERAYEAPL
jgi:hypothetical protein